MPGQLSPFNIAWDAALKAVKASHGVSQAEVGNRLGVSRGLVQGARSLPKALSYQTLDEFCSQFEVPPVMSFRLRWSWLEERITHGAIGASVRTLLDYDATRFGDDELIRVQVKMIESFEAARGQDDES